MIEELENSILMGVFMLPSGKKVHGNLKLATRKSCLELWGEKLHEEIYDRGNLFINIVEGTVNDWGKVSLIDCIFKGDRRSKTTDILMPSIFTATFSFSYALFGHDCLSRDEKTIKKVSFLVDDADALFYDTEAFLCAGEFFSVSGKAISDMKMFYRDARPLVEQMAEHDENIKTGDYPAVICYTGKREIFEAETALGKISARRSVPASLSHKGGKMENKTYLSLQFSAPVNFRDAHSKAMRVLRFIELMAGRSQNLVDFLLWIEPENAHVFSRKFRMYDNWFPKRERLENRRAPKMLIEAVGDTEGFSRVLVNWLEHNAARGAARDRFFSCFFAENIHDRDRLVGVAGAFDLLPEEAVHGVGELSEELESARDKCLEVFRELEESSAKNSFLRALNRVGKSDKKSKSHLGERIDSRARYITDKIGDKLPGFLKVTREAVDCRNYCVHGGPPNVYYREAGVIRFFANTLEFVFAGSDLVEAGWDIQAWYEKEGLWSHPFGAYLHNYKANLQGIESIRTRS